VKIAALVPMRHSSERVPGKNYRVLGDRPLYQHIVGTLLEVPEIDEVVIDTDSQTIMEQAASAFPNVRVLERPQHLRAGEIPMNDVLLNTIRQLDADVFLQTHSTNPFLTAQTIGAALRHYVEGRESGTHDSLFTVTRLQARLWSEKAEPINHDPSVLLRTQDLPPVFLENSCGYVFTRDTLVERGNRIGASPLLFEVDHIEAIDIDEERDFRLAEAVWAARAALSEAGTS
jgi:CMP-N-acetylneuraminic acid synthetase